MVKNKKFGKFERFNFPEYLGNDCEIKLFDGFTLKGELYGVDPYDDTPYVTINRRDGQTLISVDLEELDTMFVELDDGTWVEILPGDEMPVRR